MTQLNELRDWLNSDKRNFDTGLQLYIAYFNDIEMRRFLIAHRNEGKLYDLIRARVIELKEASNGQNSSLEEKIVHEEMHPINSTKVKALHKNEIVAKLEKEWKLLRAEQGVWHTQMSDVGLDRELLTKTEIEKRSELASKLITHEIEISRIWNLIDYVEINGQLPEGENKPKTTIANAVDFKRLKNQIAPNISKLKKKIANGKLHMQKLTGKPWEKLNDKLTDWENQLKELEAEKEQITNGNTP